LLFVQQLQLVWPQEDLQVSIFILFQTSVHHLLDTSWIHLLLIALTMLPIPQHGLLKDPPSFVAICTPQGLVVKVTCMQDVWIIAEGFPERAWAFLLSAFVHNPAQPESLGIIAWLLHCCCFLAACAEDMVVSRPSLIVAMSTQTLCSLCAKQLA
jgi:hypothetical protein